jgi:hypothetical protein
MSHYDRKPEELPTEEWQWIFVPVVALVMIGGIIGFAICWLIK